jgi:hypothetical protein
MRADVVERVDPEEKQVFVTMTKDQVKQAPTTTPTGMPRQAGCHERLTTTGPKVMVTA